jgi:outer membrane protein assembly factor BamB
MKIRTWLLAAVVAAAPAAAADWPQWRGPNRDAKITGFEAPATWPKELTKKWKVTVGDGVSTPALVGDKLYVFSRQGGDEVTRCLNAADGKEVWINKYSSAPGKYMGRGSTKFDGPRASPTVADGKVITFGVQSELSCLDSADGKVIWRKESLGGVPPFSTASSPIVADGFVISEYGGQGGGGIAAYNLYDGKRKWYWEGDGASYASPSLLTVSGTGAIIAEMSGNVVAVNAADGKLLWETQFKERYNASTPIVDGSTIIYSGPQKGTTAVAVEKSGDKFATKELWNTRTGTQYNTPVIKNGFVYGLSSNDRLFCLSAADGKQLWQAQVKGAGGYGNIVDAGSVLFSLTPAGELIVFEPNDKEFKKVASYPNVGSNTYAYPVIAGKRIYIKDADSVTLWEIE